MYITKKIMYIIEGRTKIMYITLKIMYIIDSGFGLYVIGVWCDP